MCKTKCRCNYRISQTKIAGETIYYPEYSRRLFPWRWKRMDIYINDKASGKPQLIYFGSKESAESWLNRFKTEKEPTDRVYQL